MLGEKIPKKNKEILVIGHKNPDTDSICSAIAYADLKHRLTGKNYVPCRAGYINPETEFVLRRFDAPMPRLVNSIQTQVSDIELRTSHGVSRDLSLKEAWKMMSQDSRVTLAVVDEENRVEGLITIGDIANSYMNIYRNDILSVAKTPYHNIVSALEGRMVVGDENDCFEQGKVLVAATNLDLLETYVEPGDIVMLGNRYECQICAIDMKAGCLILCAGAPLSKTIRHMAEQAGCKIILTDFDTYTATRFIHQSMPIRFMMTSNVLSFRQDDYTEKVKEVMSSKRHRYFPVTDADGKYCGLISRRDFLGMHGKEVILVDHNERTQAVDGVDSADVLEIIDHHRIGSLETMNPVFFRNQPVGCTATIIYEMYCENKIEIPEKIAGLLVSAIISDTLLFRSPTCTEKDRKAAEALAAICGIDLEKYSKQMFSAGSNLDGKKDAEIFFQDYKVFNVEGKRIGIGQISSVLTDEMEALKGRMTKYLVENHRSSGMDYVYLIMTSIMDEKSEVICDGEPADQLLEMAFPGCTVEDHRAVLDGVVSRKKQFVPAIIAAIKE